jgi:hypothetical protein
MPEPDSQSVNPGWRIVTDAYHPEYSLRAIVAVAGAPMTGREKFLAKALSQRGQRVRADGAATGGRHAADEGTEPVGWDMS